MFRSLLVAVVTTIVLMCSITAHAEKPIGCRVISTYSWHYGVTSTNQQTICQQGMCRTISLPGCTPIEVCFGAYIHYCETLSCHQVYEGNVDIPCNTSRSFPYHCYADGARGSYICSGPPTCDSTDWMDIIDGMIQDWMSGNPVTLGSYNLNCQCGDAI